MTGVIRDLARTAGLWLVLVFGQALGGALFLRHAPAFAPDGPLGAVQAMLAVGLIDAVILALLAGAMRTGRWARAAACALVLFGVQSALSAIEAVVFAADVHLPRAILLGTVAVAALRAALAGGAIALLWREGGAEPLAWRGLVWRLPLIAGVYVACYFAAGALIAWPSPAVRAYYAHIGQIDVGMLAAIQVGRGLLWGGLALVLASQLGPGRWRAAALTGLAFSGFMAPSLLYPNPAMPWAVRQTHLVEIGVSNFLFGVIAALILLGGARTLAGSEPAVAAARAA